MADDAYNAMHFYPRSIRGVTH